MRDLLSNQSVKTVVSCLRSLPSLPALYGEVMTQLRSEEPSFTQIARIISEDVGMATKILQLANSAFMGTSGRVSSLLQALTLIGVENVRTLVLSVNVFRNSMAMRGWRRTCHPYGITALRYRSWRNRLPPPRIAGRRCWRSALRLDFCMISASWFCWRSSLRIVLRCMQQSPR